MSLTAEDRVTVITWDDASKTAYVYTHDKKMKNELAKLASERPADCKMGSSNPEGADWYKVPKKWVKIRATRVMTDEQRNAASERLAKYRNGV